MRNFITASAIGVFMVSLVGYASAAAQPVQAAPAVIHVALPADATLTLNGAKTVSTSAERSFITPPLDAGKSYTYNLKAAFVRDGMNVTIERKVQVRAGDHKMVSMDAPLPPHALYRSYYGGAANLPETNLPPLPMMQLPVVEDHGYLASDGAG